MQETGIQVFITNTKLAEMTVLTSKDLTKAKYVTSSGAQPQARYYYCFRSPMPHQLN